MRESMIDHDPVIMARDVESAAEARALVDPIGDHTDFYKILDELQTVSRAQPAWTPSFT